MRAWNALVCLGGLLAMLAVSPASAQCENTAKSCLEAKRFHQRLCARVGLSSERRDCYRNGEKAYNDCLKTGKWATDRCDLSGLPKR